MTACYFADLVCYGDMDVAAIFGDCAGYGDDFEFAFGFK